jgi:nucleoid DNA-binding protein
MTITSAVYDLLQTHDCVIVPGLGAFLARNKSAVIQSDGTILPPRRMPSFNSRLNDNDGLLVHFLAISSGNTFEQAQREVENFVQTTLALLQQHEHIYFTKLGSLSIDIEGNLQFKPCDNGEIFSEFFGLASIAPLPVSATPKKDVTATPLPHHHLADTNPGRAKKKTGNKQQIYSYIKYAVAALALIVITLSGVVGLLRYEQDKVSHTASLAPVMDSSRDSEVEKTFSANETHSIDKPKHVESYPLSSQTISKESLENNVSSVSDHDLPKGFYIIVGSFAKQENADALYHQLQTELQGSAQVVKIPRKRLTAVGFYSSADIVEATSMLARAKRKDPSVWLLQL